MSIYDNKTEFETEIDKVKGMNGSEKWSYFKEYYLKATIVILVLIVGVILFIKDTAFQKKGICNGCAYNLVVTDEQKEMLTTGYLEYYEYNQKKYSAYLSTDNLFEGTAQQMDAYTHEMALFAQIAAGEIQYMILDGKTLENFADGGIYSDLNDILSDDTKQKVEGMMVNVHENETNADYPGAIDLVKLGFFDKSVGEAYLVFTAVQPDATFADYFLKYLLAI